jgi:hypothetical protein
MAADGRITMPDVTLATAPWAIAGTVTDSRGNPIAGAVVGVNVGGLFTPSESVTTDRDGRYRFTSSASHFDTVNIGASVTGGFVRHSPLSVPCCNPPADTIFDIRVVRVVSFTPHAPSTLRVGEQVEIPPADVVFDDDTSTSIYVMPTSSTPTEVAVDYGQRGFVVRGVKVGLATLTFELYGLRASLQVRVVE